MNTQPLTHDPASGVHIGNGTIRLRHAAFVAIPTPEALAASVKSCAAAMGLRIDEPRIGDEIKNAHLRGARAVYFDGLRNLVYNPQSEILELRDDLIPLYSFGIDERGGADRAVRSFLLTTAYGRGANWSSEKKREATK